MDNSDKIVCLIIFLAVSSGVIGIFVIFQLIHSDYGLIGVIGFMLIPILFLVAITQADKKIRLQSLENGSGKQ